MIRYVMSAGNTIAFVFEHILWNATPNNFPAEMPVTKGDEEVRCYLKLFAKTPHLDAAKTR